jgi:uncharacterized membrane protein YphA (DoxX/SURF4 family)
VRRSRVLSWVDVGILTVWYASIVVAGVFSSPLAAVAVVVFTLVAFWGVVWQLVVETRQRINLAFASYGAVPVTSR